MQNNTEQTVFLPNALPSTAAIGVDEFEGAQILIIKLILQN